MGRPVLRPLEPAKLPTSDTAVTTPGRNAIQSSCQVLVHTPIPEQLRLADVDNTLLAWGGSRSVNEREHLICVSSSTVANFSKSSARIWRTVHALLLIIT